MGTVSVVEIHLKKSVRMGNQSRAVLIVVVRHRKSVHMANNGRAAHLVEEKVFASMAGKRGSVSRAEEQQPVSITV